MLLLKFKQTDPLLKEEWNRKNKKVIMEKPQTITNRPEKNWLLKMKKNLNKFALALFFFFAFSSTTFGQGIPGAGVNVSIQPRNPKAFQTITISLESFSTDLNQANIKWYLNGSLQKEGRAMKNFTAETGSLGSVLTAEVVIDTKNLGVITKKVTVIPAEVEIIGQADSFVPPFYKGKVLASTEGYQTLIAIPSFVTKSGRKISPNDIVFKWERNGSVLSDDSGLGRSLITVKVPYIKEAVEKFEVEVSAPEHNLNATEIYFVSPENPQIVFYENNPLLGVMFNRALNETLNLNKDEIAIIAYPFAFNKGVITSADSNFSWKINNNKVSPTGKRNIITLRRPTDSKGVSSVSLSIENSKRVFESAYQSLRINLGNSDTQSPQF